VLNAVKLMYAGAAVSLVSLVVTLATLGDTKAVIRKHYPHYTAAQINQLNSFGIAVDIVFALLGIGLWLWMARANNQGRNWARIVSTILFVVSTIDAVHVFSVPHTALDLVFPLLVWLVGAGAIFLLWRPDSTAFFKSAQGSLLSRRSYSSRSRVGPVPA
jgi:hypothetical protein